MADDKPHSTMERPDEKLISRFAPWQVRDRTIRNYLEKGFSLGICCRNCPRTIEWTPPELLQRFANWLDLPLTELVPRLPVRTLAGAELHFCVDQGPQGVVHPQVGAPSLP